MVVISRLVAKYFIMSTRKRMSTKTSMSSANLGDGIV